MIRLALLALAALLLPLSAHAQADLARETAKVEDLRSIREIKRLQAYWGHLAIAGDWRGMAGLVTDDARVVLPAGDAVGPEGIEAWLRERMGGGIDGMPAGKLNLRLYISPVITLAPDGRSATGRWHQVALLGEAGRSAEWLGTTDVVQYRKTGEGWRIAHVRPYLQFAGPYDSGWRHDAETLERAPYHYTPDQAGIVLPDRRAAVPRDKADLEREANLLFEASRVRNLVAAFGYYLDRGMYADIVELFYSDGGVNVIGHERFPGTDGVRRFLAKFGAPGLDHGELNDRPQLMPLVTMSEDGVVAGVSTIELGMSGRHGEEGSWSATLNNFLLMRGPDNIWRISNLFRYPLMQADYAQGWSQDGAVSALVTEGRGALPRHPATLMIPGSVEDADPPMNPNALALAEAFDGAENVSNAYGYYIDQFAWRDTGELFARDGWKELSYIGTFVGKDRVTNSMIQRYGEGGPNDAFQAIHQKTQPYVTPLGDGTRAMIRTRLMQFNSSSTGPGSWIGGIYENQIVKEDGVWKIAGMDLDYVWLADYAAGWTGIDPEASKRFAPTAEQLEAFGPDAPLRGETFAPYPRIAPMGFHFANPVSGREPETRLAWSDGNREEK